MPRSLASTITLVLIRTVVVVVNINVLPVAERNKLLILLAVPAILAVIYYLKELNALSRGLISLNNERPPTYRARHPHGPSASFPWAPT